MKQLKKFLIGCFAVSVITAIALSTDGSDDYHGIASIGWLILAAACVLAYTKIVIEENRNKT